MAATPDYPLRFRPLLKTRVWGGSALAERAASDPGEPIGESWEIADHGADVSTVVNGPLAGTTLRELFETGRAALVGRSADPASPERFPLLLKLLESRKSLSVQVHPDDASAARRTPGELGKTEAWYILDADPGAAIYHGLRDGVDRERLREAIDAGTVEACLQRVEVRPGQVFYIPSGTVHALGAGVRLAEIQQNSDTTYRLFDWNRVGLDGKPRELHVEESLAVADVHGRERRPREPEVLPGDGLRRERFIDGEKFTFDRLSDFGAGAELSTGGSTFHILVALGDGLAIEGGGVREELRAWETCLLPAACGTYRLGGSEASVALCFSAPERE